MCVITVKMMHRLMLAYQCKAALPENLNGFDRVAPYMTFKPSVKILKLDANPEHI